MYQCHLEIHRLAIEQAHCARDGLGDSAYVRAARHVGPIPHHHAGRRESGDPDLHALAGDDGVRREHQGVAVGGDVGGDVPVRGIRGGVPQHVHAEVEFVVAGSRGVVLQRVERIDDRIGALRRLAREVGREGVALDQIARIDENHLVGILRPQRPENRRGA